MITYRQSVACLGLALAMLVLTPAEAGVRLTVPADRGDGTEDRYALIVDVNEYAYLELPPSRLAAASVSERLQKSLVAQGYQATLIRGADADRRTVVGAMARLGGLADADDTVIAVVIADVLTDVRRTIDYVAAYDTRKAELEADALRLRYLIDLFAEVPTQRRLLIAQLTHIGTVENLVTTRYLRNPGSGDRERLLDTVATTSEASGANTAVQLQTLDEARYGEVVVLGDAVAEALSSGAADVDEDGRVSAGELLRYLADRAPSRTLVVSTNQRADLDWRLAWTGHRPRSMWEADIALAPSVVEEYKKIIGRWRVEGVLGSSASYALYYLLDQVAGRPTDQVDESCLALFLEVEPLLEGAAYEAQTRELMQVDLNRNLSIGSVDSATKLEKLLEKGTGCLGYGKKR